MRIPFLFLLAALAALPQWVDPNTTTPAGTRYATFHSAIAQGDVSYLVRLPDGYEASERRYPVIYWLHGLGGSQRGGQSFLQAIEGKIDAIVILVNGWNDSMYQDSKDGSRPMARVVAEDLVRHVDTTYRTRADRAHRAIEGYSMGGFGAAGLGFRYPDTFGLVSIMAGALHTEDTLAERRAAIFAKVNGGDKAHFHEQSPWTIVDRNASKIRGRTRVRIGVGSEDALLAWNRQYHEKMKALGIDNEFFIVDGIGHNGAAYYEALGERVAEFYREAWPK
jgi:endo-1,4-beta-xylanase